MDEQDRNVRISQYMLDHPVATLAVRIDQAVEKTIGLRVLNSVVQVAFLLVTKALAIRDKELEVAGVWLIHLWIVNLIYDPVAQCEP
jgi:hypothetical protein